VSWKLPVASSTEPYSYRFAGATYDTLGVAGSYFGATAGVNLQGSLFGSGPQTACTTRLKGGWSFTGADGLSDISFQSPPQVAAVGPNSAALGAQNLDVDVTGQDFAPNDTLAFSGDGITVNSTTYVSPGEMTANISIDGNALAGMRDVTITDSTLGTGTCKDCFMVAPIVFGASPSALGRGATAKDVTIYGVGFAPGAIVDFSDPGITVNYTQYLSPNQLVANVAVSSLAAVAPADVSVIDPGQGIGTCPACVTVNDSPTVTSTTPGSRGVGATNQVVAINGTNFVSGAAVTFNNPGISVGSVAFVSSTKLNATISIAPGSSNGAGGVKVTNPDGGLGSCSNCFVVNRAPTVTNWLVTNMSNAVKLRNHHGIQWTARQIYNATVEITGTGFVTGLTGSSMVTYASDDVDINSTTIVSSTKIKMNVDIDVLDYWANALPVDRSITVTNPDGGRVICEGCVVIIV